MPDTKNTEMFASPLRLLRRRAIVGRAAVVLPLALAAAFLTHWLGCSLMVAAGVALAALALCTGQLWFSRGYRQITVENFLLHLNRADKGFEESAQLITRDGKTLSILQRLQKDKVRAHYEKLIATPAVWLPARETKGIKIASVLCIIALALNLLPSPDWTKNLPTPSGTAGGQQDEEAPAALQFARIGIMPPAYTGLPTAESADLNISALEGSNITWHLRLSRTDGRYEIRLRDGATAPLMQAENGELTASMVASNTGLYRIVHIVDDEALPLEDIYTLTAEKDRAPQIRVLEPKTTTLEIPRKGPATFPSTALITDDYGIQDVFIRASVAKGTGEAVKFRDEVFTFDRQEISEQGTLFHKDWDLPALGMEPGDEIYFTVVALDNKTPDANEGKSATVIVRWLDEVEREIAAEGIVSNFVPEYFKSQRQIIIETEQLIADKPVLEKQVFANTSYSLGYAQNDLKQRYGQYLGDEFGEGPGDQLTGGGAAAEADHHDDEDGEDEHHEEGERPEIGHDHGNEAPSTDKTGAADLIAKFGHAHEDADIGPIAKRDPKTLMKKAVSIMWQAELHLMLAEPEKALPFEYEALKYLKLAKQADRIYVKRLGFEPPPVSEERRLEGELDEIESFESSITPGLETVADARLVAAVYSLLSTKGTNYTLTEEDRTLLTDLSAHLMALSADRPAMVTYAATVEKMLMGGSLTLPACDGCTVKLGQALWAMLPSVTAPPRSRDSFILFSDPLASDMMEKGVKP